MNEDCYGCPAALLCVSKQLTRRFTCVDCSKKFVSPASTTAYIPVGGKLMIKKFHSIDIEGRNCPQASSPLIHSVCDGCLVTMSMNAEHD